MEAIADPSAVNDFLKTWKGNAGSERSNFQFFVRDLCSLLDLSHPEPGEGDKTLNTHVPFPDPRRFEIRLDDLRKPEVTARLRQLWLEPENLDPRKRAARVTREVSTKLAELAKSLEHSVYDVEHAVSFLKR